MHKLTQQNRYFIVNLTEVTKKNQMSNGKKTGGWHMLRKRILSIGLSLLLALGSTAFCSPAVYAAEEIDEAFATGTETPEELQNGEEFLLTIPDDEEEPQETEIIAVPEESAETEAAGETEVTVQTEEIPEIEVTAQTEEIPEAEAAAEAEPDAGPETDTEDESPEDTEDAGATRDSQGEEFYYQFRDWSALPGWDRTYPRQYYVKAADGEEYTYDITDIVPVSEGWENIIEIRKDYRDNDPSADDWWWYVRARSGGTVELEVQALRLDGSPWSYSYFVYVSEDAYFITVDSESGQDYHLPGDTTVLNAYAEHYSTDPEREGDLSRLSYEWSIYSGEEGVEELITPYEGDPSRAQVVFRDLPEGTDEVEVYIQVFLLDENYNRVGQSGWIMWLRDSYKEVYPTRINRDLPVGGTEEITAELRSYPADTPEGYELVGDAGFRWYYDPQAVEVLTSDGRIVSPDGGDPIPSSDGTCAFTIRRLGEWDTNLRLEAVWTENGEERISFKDYNLNRCEYRIWIDDQGNNRLFSGSTLEFRLITEGLDGLTPDQDYEIELNVGRRGFDRWDTLFERGQEYDFNKDTGIITLYGDKIFATGVDQVNFYAGISLKTGEGEDDWRLVSDFTDCWAEIREERFDLDREWDRSMLRGWDGNVNGRRNVYVENAQFPDGEDFEYHVTDVEIIRDEPWEGQKGPVITDFHRDQNGNDPEDYWWYYRVENYGEAALRVTYQLPDELGGGTDSYEFTLYVGRDVYNVMLVTDDGVNRALPGGMLDLFALTWRESEYDNSLDGITYHWEILDNGEDFAELTEIPDEPWHRQLRFRDLYDWEDRIWQDVRVRVTIFDGTDEETGEPIEQASNELNLVMASDYRQIMPTLAGFDLEMGEAVTSTWEVRQYPEDNADGYSLIDNVHYYWYYDPNCVRITDQNGQEVGNNDDTGNYNDSDASVGTQCVFTIERLGNWGTNIHLEAVWENENGDRQNEGYDYFLDNKDYNIWFDPDRASVYDDNEKTVTLNTQQLGRLECSIEYEIGRHEYDEETDTGTWIEMYDEESGIYRIDGNDITISGEKLAERNLDGVNIHAKLIYHGQEIRDAWCWVEFNESCGNHFWATGTWKEASCEEPGMLIMICPHCFEIRWEEIPAKGHALEKVAAKAATLTAEGNIEYYRCSECGKLFLDDAGNEEISIEDTVIAKLLPQAITAKAKATSVAVGKTTTITVTGNIGKLTYKSANTKIATVSSTGKITAKAVGTVKITVTAAASGLYGKASKTITIKVTNGAQPMTAAAVKKTVLYTKVKTAAQTVTGAITVKNAQGKVTYVKSSGSSALTINKTTGAVTVKKGTAKGTYKIVVKVSAAGNTNYNAGSKSVTVTVVVK